MRVEDSLDDVLQRCREGDPAGFAEVYRQLNRPLYGTALRLLSRPEDAEEAMQDTFISLYRKVPDLPGSQLRPWMHRVLVNHCIDRLRRRKRWGETELNEAISAGPSRPDGLRLDIQAAVDRLPRRARMVFLLHDVEGFKHREIGDILGLSVGATKSQLFRARDMMRRHLKRPARGSS